MSVNRIMCFALIALLIAIFGYGCDDYNIVEPRFYKGDFLSDSEPITGGGIRFWLPVECDVDLYLIGSAGEIIKVFYEGEHFHAGVYGVSFNWREEDGHKYPDGIYCWLLRTGDFEYFKCVDYDNPEDYLP